MGSADAQLMPSTEKPSDTFDDVRADRRIGKRRLSRRHSSGQGIAQKVERLFSGVTQARLGGMDRQAEFLQPV